MNKNTPFTSPSGNSYSKEEISPYLLEVAQVTKSELPDFIGNRLSHGRKAVTHGSYVDFYMLNMWDKNQTDVLPRSHFTYCLSYWGNRRKHARDGELHLWLNKIRMYQNRKDIIALLDKRLPNAIPDGFTYESTERFYTVSHRFWFPSDLDLLVGYIVPIYKQLILAMHPILMEVIDEHTGVLDRESIKAVIRERDRIPFKHPGRRTSEELRGYSRSVPPTLRKKILKKAGFRCAECGTDLRISGHHIDHILAFSKGGLTVEENLQALCSRCNLSKGNR